MSTVRTFLNEDGSLRFVEWAQQDFSDRLEHDVLVVDATPRPIQMAHSHATGAPLVSNGWLGADMIRLSAGQGFQPHTHEGDHLLFVVHGVGTITYGGKIYPTRAGQVYMIEGRVPHAVGAISDHVIVAVGAPHRAVDSPERMTVVAYQEVVADIGELHCLICDTVAALPIRLHEAGCSHCPCPECMG